VNSKLKTLKTEGTFSGVIKADGSNHAEYVGQNFNFVMDLSIIEEKQESILFNYEQSLTVDGVTKKSAEVVEVPKEQVDIVNQDMLVSLSNTPSIGLLRLTKINVPSYAPLGSVLIYNDLQYADLLVSSGIIVAVMAFFGLTVAAGLAAIAAAVLAAIPEYYDVDYRNIYLDFFLTPSLGMHVEVDYFYI